MIIDDIKKDDGLKLFCEKHEYLFIYGAGRYAEDVFGRVKQISNKKISFIVSEGHKKKNTHHNLPLIEVSHYEHKKENGIIIALHDSKEIKTLLEDKGVDDEDIWIKNYKKVNTEMCYTGGVNKDGPFFEQYKELDTIGLKYNTDKNSDYHDYLRKYEFFLEKLVNNNNTILELGVLNGASLKMWGEYFKNSIIIGVDINKDCIKYSGNNKEVIICDLSDEIQLEALAKKVKAADLIIDDASHFHTHQIIALIKLFPILKSGGIYIVEDLETSFEIFNDTIYADSIVTGYEFCEALCERFISLKQFNLNEKVECLQKYIDGIVDEINMITFINGSCIIIKK